MLVKRKGTRIRTTDSDHCYRKYPNRVKNLIPQRPNEMWVSDLTYFPLGSHFVYLTVVMDVYSRKIVRLVVAKNAGSERFTTSS